MMKLRPAALFSSMTALLPAFPKARSAIAGALTLVCLSAPLAAVAEEAKPTRESATPPPRIVALLPSLTEIVFAVGAGDTLVGVDAKSDYPAAARALPRIGGFQGLSLETIVSLRPTHILVMEGYHVSDYASLGGFGAELVRCDFADLEDVKRCTLRIGEITGHQVDARRRVVEYEASQARVAARIAKLPTPRTLVLVSVDPLYAAGERSFSGDMLRLAGGVNALQGTSAAYPLISGESIVASEPEFIIALNKGDRERLLAIPGLQGVAAVRKGQVHSVSKDIFSRPGPRAFLALEELAGILHPGKAEQTAGKPLVKP